MAVIEQRPRFVVVVVVNDVWGRRVTHDCWWQRKIFVSHILNYKGASVAKNNFLTNVKLIIVGCPVGVWKYHINA